MKLLTFQFLLTGLVLVLLQQSPVMAQGTVAGNASSEEKSSITDVVKELLNEAQVAYNAQQWFHLDRSYASRHRQLKDAFTADQVRLQLSREHHSNPIIDAYVKMNLMDFLPYDAMSEMQDKKRWMLIKARPSYPKKPRPRNDQYGSMNTINGIKVASINQIRQAEKAWEDYHNSEAMVMWRSEIKAVKKYRETLVELLPDDTFMKTYLKVVDLTERIENGQMDAISRKLEDGTQLKTRDRYFRDGKKFNAEPLFDSLISARDLNPKTLKVVERAVRHLARSQGFTYVKPNRKKPGDEWQSGRYQLNFENPAHITESFKLALMKYADARERRREIRARN